MHDAPRRDFFDEVRTRSADDWDWNPKVVKNLVYSREDSTIRNVPKRTSGAERAVPNERCRTNGAERTGTNGDTHEQTVPKCADKPNGNVCAVRDPDSSHQDLPRYEQKSHMRKTS